MGSEMTNTKPTYPANADGSYYRPMRKADDFRPRLPNDAERSEYNERADQPEVDFREPVECREYDRGDY